MTSLKDPVLSIQDVVSQQLSSIERLCSVFSVNDSYCNLEEIVFLQCYPFEKTIHDISKKYNIPIEQFHQNKKITKTLNPYRNLPIERLQFQIKGQYPFIFCDDWNQSKCADFLLKSEEKEEYELHPLFFKYKNLSLRKLQQMIGNKKIKNKKNILKNIIENSSIVFTDDSKLAEDYHKLSENELVKILKSNFPGFPIPSKKEHIVSILSLF